MCKKGGEGGDDSGDNEGPRLFLNGGVLEEVEQFCYLGDVLDCVQSRSGGSSANESNSCM